MKSNNELTALPMGDFRLYCCNLSSTILDKTNIILINSGIQLNVGSIKDIQLIWQQNKSTQSTQIA